jgi:hypothetical protein
MVKKDHLKIFLVFLLSSFLFLSAQSQNRKYFIITGTIITENQSFENSFIQIKKLNNDSLVFPLQGNGRFRLELNYNSNYTLTFIQKGCSSKSVVVNTKLPDDVLNQPANLAPFIMAVRLTKENQESESTNSDGNQMKIAYSEITNEFTKVAPGASIKNVDKDITGINPEIKNARLNAFKTF